MTRRLPPLSALQSFEAASRMLSFSRAAEELNVTAAAVSHQIRMLEQRLGIALFRREASRIALTDRGQALLPAVREALQLLAEATDEATGADSARPVKFSVLPTFAVRWLIPRLARFRALHPDIELALSTSHRAVSFGEEDVDAAVRYGAGDWPGLAAWSLSHEALLPVCSPRLLQGRPLREPGDLAGFPLLHAETCEQDWRLWLSGAGDTTVNPTRGMRFDSALLVLQAACEGLGVAVASRIYVERDLAEGTLVAPFDFVLTRNVGWHFVCPPHAAARPRLAALRCWLLAEFGRSDLPA